MKFAPSRRKSIRYSIFIGVLAGSVFSGSGALANPTPVNSVGQLLGVTGNTSYVLTIDLDLSTAVATNNLEAIQLADVWADVFIEGAPVLEDGIQAVGSTTYISGAFTGMLDGGGFTISGLTKPLFDTVSGEVRNLNLATEIVNGVTGDGALADTLETGATVNNVDVTGNVTGGAEVGGLVGFSSGTITNSSMNGEVNGDFRVGGLVGVLSTGGTITGSQATGDVTSTSNGDRVGGLVGQSDGNISGSSAEGNVSGGHRDVGGLVGYSSGDIANSHATGDVSGEDRVGGLVGQSDGDITFSYAKGEVTSTLVEEDGVHGELAPGGANGIGGLVGYNTGTITSSFTGEADTDSPIPSGAVTGLKNVGGLVGFSSGTITISRATGDVNQSWACFGGATCFEYIGGLVGRSTGEIKSSWASGNVGGQDYVGGLVGKSEDNITNSFAAGYVGGDDYVGGLVGYSSGDITIGETYADKPLDPDYVYGNEFVGGLVGYSEGNVIDSVSRVPVRGGRYVGGLVGKSEGNITNSVAEGEVRGLDSEVGGLVGYSVGDITDSSATGDVSGFGMGGPTDYIGGLVGYLEGVIKNSFATGSVRGRDNVGGLVGSIDTLPWLDPYLDLNALETYYVNRGTPPEIGEINLVQGDFYIWDGENWTKIFNISGSYAAEGDVTGRSYVGGLVGSSSLETTITDSYATGVVIGDGEYIGGFIGDAGYDSKISNSYTTGSVTGTNESEHGVGGFAGYLSGSLINTYATGNVNGFDEVGGLVGSTGIAEELSITDSHATGSVSGREKVGGLVGELDYNYTITNSYARDGAVSGIEWVGGLVGYAEGDITDSYAEGAVSGTDDKAGGLVGESSGFITNSHAIGNVTGSYNVGGLVGRFYENREIDYSYVDLDTLRTMTEIFNSDDEVPDVIPGSFAAIAGEIYFYTYPSGEFLSEWVLFRNVVTITNSYAKGNVTGTSDIGGLVGNLGDWARITNSYATGNVIGKVEDEGGDAGGLVGLSSGVISNSHASGDVSGFYDIGGLVGDLQGTIFIDGDPKGTGSITNSYATGNVRATGSDGDWSNGWGGLVGESSGLISNSYATGNVVADYNFGSLIGYLMLNENLDLQILNSFATGSTSRANNVVRLYETVFDPDSETYFEVVLDLDGLGGFVGCAVEDGSDGYSCIPEIYETFPETTPSILSVVNTVDDGEPAFEIVACKNNGLPLLSILDDSYANTCTSNPPAASVSAVLASVVQLNPKFNLLESTTLRLFLYLAGDDTIRITVEDFVVLGVTGVNKANLPLLLKLLKDVDLFTLNLKTINKNVKIADDLLKKKKKK